MQDEKLADVEVSEKESLLDSSIMIEKTRTSYDLFVKTLNEFAAAYEIQEDPNARNEKITFREVTLSVYYHKLYSKVSSVSITVMFSQMTGLFPNFVPRIIDNQKWNAEIDKVDIIWNRNSNKFSVEKLAEMCIVRLIEVDSSKNKVKWQTAAFTEGDTNDG